MPSKEELTKYYEEEYLGLNPTLHREDSLFKISEIMQLFKKNKISSEVSIVEMGCGSGRIGAVIAEINHSVVVRCDISKSILYGAQKGNKFNSLAVVQSDCEQAPFKDNSVDVVLLIDVIEHLKNPETCIAESARITKKYVIIRTPLEDCLYHNMKKSKAAWASEWKEHCGHIWKFNQPLLEKFLSQNNLRVVEAKLSKLPFSWIKKRSLSTSIYIILSRILPSGLYKKLLPGEIVILAEHYAV